MLVLMMMEDMLDDLGCRAVSTAPSVVKALGLIQAHSFDVAMLDMNLDGADTYQIADALAARGVPYVFATGYGNRDIKEGYGDRPMLKKPFSIDELAAVMTRLVGS